MSNIRCNICGSDTITILAQEKMYRTAEAFRYNQCVACKHTVLQDIPDDMSKYYPPSYYSLKKRTPLDYILSLKKSLGYKAVEKLNIPKETHILDYGSGRNDLVYEMHMHGYKDTWGYDPYVAKKTVLDNTKWGMIMLHHVIEHVPNPSETLIELKQRLFPNGILLLRFPVIDSYAFEKYNTDWVGFDAPRHITLFSRHSIWELARDTGFRVVDMYDDSSHFQFTASELYKQDRPLSDHGLISRIRGYNKYKDKAIQLNRKSRGDQVVMVLKIAQ